MSWPGRNLQNPRPPVGAVECYGARMTGRIPYASLIMMLLAAALAPAAAPARADEHPPVAALPEERHLADLRQLTFGGENAEAYFSWSGRELILQARPSGEGCDRIYRMDWLAPAAPLRPVSNGKGATTCS